MKHFNWMVFDHADQTGLWFLMTQNKKPCVFYWNPLRTLYTIINGNWTLGFFPISIKHIKF